MNIRGDVSAIADQIEEAANDAFGMAPHPAEAVEIEAHLARIESAVADIRDRLTDLYEWD